MLLYNILSFEKKKNTNKKKKKHDCSVYSPYILIIFLLIYLSNERFLKWSGHRVLDKAYDYNLGVVGSNTRFSVLQSDGTLNQSHVSV